MVKNDEHTKTVAGSGSLLGSACIDEQRLKGLYGLSVRLQSTDAVVCRRESIAPVGGVVRSPLGRLLSASEKSVGWRQKRKRRASSSRGEPGGDKRGGEECCEPDTGIEFGNVSESVDSDSPRKRSSRIIFSNERLQMAIVKIASRSTCRVFQKYLTHFFDVEKKGAQNIFLVGRNYSTSLRGPFFASLFCKARARGL